MDSDEQSIRALIAAWARATASGDLLALMTMMSADVVFLTPGKPPMRRDDFAAAFTETIGHVRIDAVSDIQEIRVCGEWAWCWNRLGVTVTPLAGGEPERRVGHALTIFRNEGGAWMVARDANLMA